MEKNKTEIMKEKILQRIKAGEVSMHPKIFYTLQWLGVIVASIVVLLTSVFILNFIFFSLRINEYEEYLKQGGSGLIRFLTHFPWGLLLIDLIFSSILVWLIRKFNFGYKHSVLYILGIILLSSFVAGYIVDRHTPFNDHLLQRHEEHRLPEPLEHFYGNVRHDPDDFLSNFF